MGKHEDWAQPNGLMPNGLLFNEEASVTRIINPERWAKAEERTAELIACIQPNPPSEERRNAVADYVQRLIMKCFSCQVFKFGSVPLKTYLPDGDIDLTAFSKNQNLKDIWANEVRDILVNEEKSENAEFRVKEVQYIQAEVKIIKCLVENIVVDISFNQLGGLCTLCFLEEVDHLINQNHLFKRSIILIKAWCYYESRILGAHHGLISTYALETLVLYIFHVFNNSFAGPLEVLYRFLEFFSNFDWDNFCVSLWGPVHISSLPDMTAEPPRKDGGELLLSKPFLDACSSVYSVFPGGQENQGQPFASKHFNVIDPLRTNNNLGRSVSKGNFFRIRSAFALGAKRLARLLDCPKEELVEEVNQFFMNTWDRHRSGNRPDAPISDLWRLQPLNPDKIDGSAIIRSSASSKKTSESSASQESEVEQSHAIHGGSSQHANRAMESMSRNRDMSAVSHAKSQKNCISRIYDHISRNISSNENLHTDKGQRNHRPDCLVNEIHRPDYLVNETQARYQFARTRSSPELTDGYKELPSRGRHNKVPETGKSQIASGRPDHGSRRKNLGSEVSGSHSRSSTEDPLSSRHSSSHESIDAAADSNSVSNSYHEESGMGAAGEEVASGAETMEMHQEEQDLVNMMASSRSHAANGQVQMPMNLASAHLPLPLSPSILASMGYAQRNFAGMFPTNIPMIEPPWAPNMQFPQEPNQEDVDRGFCHEQDPISTSGLDPGNGTFQILPIDEMQQSTSVGLSFVPSSQVSSSGSSAVRSQHKYVKENRGLREDLGDALQFQNNRSKEVYSADRTISSGFSSISQPSSSRSKPFSESSWDGSPAKVSKSARDKRGRKTDPSSPVFRKVKNGWQHDGPSVDHVSTQVDDNNRNWSPLSTMSTEMNERISGSATFATSHIQSHQIPCNEPTLMSNSDSMMPIPPVHLDSGSRKRGMDNSGVVPYAFYPTGPPVPFLTMLPVYNFPTDIQNPNASTSHFDSEDRLDNNHVGQSDQNFDLAENLDQNETLECSRYIRGATSVDPSEDHKSDILNGDFESHLKNLQYGRLCQNSRYPGPLIYPSPVMVPPVYLQGHFPWDGPGRPLSANVNLFTQLMSYGPRLVPVAPLQPTSNRPLGVYQRYGDENARYRGGTGTYLPNPKVSSRDRQSSNIRNHRGNYHDRNEHHSDREWNWNVNPKPRAAGRNHSRNQAEKPNSRLDRLEANESRSNRPWDSHRREIYPAYNSSNGRLSSSNSLQIGSTNVAYDMYPMTAVNSNGVSSSGPAIPSVVMLYPYDHNGGYSSPAEQLEFGSLGAVHFSGTNEVLQVSEGGPARVLHEQQRLSGGSPALSSPDQPSSPHPQRLAGQRNYQLKDEDFPPLSFPDQGSNGGGSEYNDKPSHFQTLFTPHS